MKQAIVVLLKAPILGKCKTRLAASIGPQRALKVYEHLMHHTASIVESTGMDSFFYFTPVIPSNFALFARERRLQSEGDLGHRMQQAFADCLNDYDQVVLIGSDCLALIKEHLLTAFECLNSNDVVFGPSLDGGYYLIGMKAMHSELFNNMEWSVETVLSHSKQRLDELQHSYAELEVLNDIDTLEDLVEEVRKLPETQQFNY